MRHCLLKARISILAFVCLRYGNLMQDCRTNQLPADASVCSFEVLFFCLFGVTIAIFLQNKRQGQRIIPTAFIAGLGHIIDETIASNVLPANFLQPVQP